MDVASLHAKLDKILLVDAALRATNIELAALNRRLVLDNAALRRRITLKKKEAE